MNYDYEIIELFKKIKHINSDNQVSNVLSLTRSHISNIKKGRNTLSEKIISHMVKIAGVKIVEAWGKRCEKRILEKTWEEKRG